MDTTVFDQPRTVPGLAARPPLSGPLSSPTNPQEDSNSQPHQQFVAKVKKLRGSLGLRWDKYTRHAFPPKSYEQLREKRKSNLDITILLYTITE